MRRGRRAVSVKPALPFPADGPRSGISPFLGRFLTGSTYHSIPGIGWRQMLLKLRSR